MEKKKSLALVSKVDPELARAFAEAAGKQTDISDFIQEFLMQFLSADTKTAYMKDLGFFFEFLSRGNVSIKHPNEIKAYHFQIYRDQLLKEGLASATINRRLVSIRSFIKWAVAARLMDHNPLDVVKLPKVQTESPTVAFDDEEVVKMLAAPDLSTAKGNLHRMSMVFLFYLGLRRSELAQIKLSHIVQDRHHMVLRVHGKGDKLRLVPLNEAVMTEMKNYLKRLGEWGVSLEANDYFLQTEIKTKNIKPIDGSTIFRIIQNYAKKLGINKKVSPHSCRATVISHLLDTQHAAIRDVATFAGHSNITTTERYDKRRKNLDKNPAYQVDFKKVI